MAKAKASQSYLVTDLSPIAYNGKLAESGEVVSDLPGESIKWLLEGGYIVPSGPQPPSEIAETPDTTPSEISADTPTEGEEN